MREVWRYPVIYPVQTKGRCTQMQPHGCHTHHRRLTHALGHALLLQLPAGAGGNICGRLARRIGRAGPLLMGSHPLHDLVVRIILTDAAGVRWVPKPVVPELHEAAIARWVLPNDCPAQSAVPNHCGVKGGSGKQIAAAATHDYAGQDLPPEKWLQPTPAIPTQNQNHLAWYRGCRGSFHSDSGDCRVVAVRQAVA